VPPTALIEHCDLWHDSDVADLRDGPMNSMAVLRRDLDDLLRKVKSSCDSYRVVDTGAEAAQTYALRSGIQMVANYDTESRKPLRASMSGGMRHGH
jgi:hypothetical protein